MTRNTQAVRALRRALVPTIEEYTTGAEADAGFDAGEWSGPASDRALEQEIETIAARIAPAFGLSGEELLQAFDLACGNETDRAMCARCSQ
jgi:hypothetical protein